MHATGCKNKDCHYPQDKGLQLVPVEMDGIPEIGGVTSVTYDCTWTNYHGPATTRTYKVCSYHYLQAYQMLEDLAEESRQIDQYLSRRRK